MVISDNGPQFAAEITNRAFRQDCETTTFIGIEHYFDKTSLLFFFLFNFFFFFFFLFIFFFFFFLSLSGFTLCMHKILVTSCTLIKITAKKKDVYIYSPGFTKRANSSNAAGPMCPTPNAAVHKSPSYVPASIGVGSAPSGEQNKLL